MEETNRNPGGSSDEIRIDPQLLSKAKKFIAKYWSYFLIVVPIIIVILVRYQTLGLTITDEWAQKSIYDHYFNQIDNQLKQQYPNMPEESRHELARNNLDVFAKQNKGMIEEQIASVSKQQKEFFQYQSGEHSYTYIGDIDSYYWLRQARNLEENGQICDVVEDGKCYDSYTIAPLKKQLPQSLHPYSIYFTYKFVKPFNPDFTLMQAQLIVPTIYAVIIAALVYIMMLRSFGLLAALVSSLLLSSSAILLSRSLGSDSDIYNVFFPVVVVFFILESFRAKTLRYKAAFAALGGISIGAYSFAWIGWWYLFDFIMIAIVANYIIWVLKESIKTKSFSAKGILSSQKFTHFIHIFAPFLIASIISIGIISGFSSLSIALKGPFGFTQTKIAAHPNLWPNVLTTVAEFNEGSLSSIISQSGGKWLFFFGLLGFVVLLYGSFRNIKKNFIIFVLSVGILYYLITPRGESLHILSYIAVLGIPFLLGLYTASKSEEEIDITFAVLLFLWTISSIYAATKGIRFTLLIATPIALGIGISFWFFHRTLTGLISKTFRVNKAIIAIIFFIAFSYPLIKPVDASFDVAKSYLPSVNDQWWDALTKINENSKPDAIINSWWDFGHWFKFISDRRVTLDGSSQNSPQLHWLGKTLLTSDEREAKNILRMLDCGGNNAFKTIDKKKNSTPSSINLLKRLLLIDNFDEAKKTLIEDGFSAAEAEEILQYSHCQAPENFFITSEDMIGKSGVWAHFGSWSFDKAWMQKTFAQIEEKEDAITSFVQTLGISKEDAQQYYSQLAGMKSESEVNAWIAPWPGYIQGESSCTAENGMAICPFQQAFVAVNLTTMDAFVPASDGIKRVNIFSYTTPTSINTKYYSESTIGLGMVLMINKDGSYTSLFMSPQLVNSTFTKLFYLEGHGTRYFEPFHSSTGNFDIKIWKVNWEGRESGLIVDRFNVKNPYFSQEQA